MKLKIGCIQSNASDDFERNLKQAIRLAREAHHAGAELIAFPEMFLFRGGPVRYREIAEKTEKVIHKFQHMACMSRIPILLGSILEKSGRANRYFNTSLLISEHGHVIAKYRKIHLFDVKTPAGFRIQESRFFLPGKSLVSVSLRNIHFGFSICFDLRFPEPFRNLAKRGAEVIFVPSNFLRETGTAHWHVLLRARAIENQVFIAAPAQAGLHPGIGRRSFGHSMMVDPWGKILAEGSGNRTEVIVAQIDTEKIKMLRKNFPIFNRPAQ